MPRSDIAILLFVTLVLAAFVVVITTKRYHTYRRRLARGSRHAKPVWKPFWIN